jgi:hypothetical protein
VVKRTEFIEAYARRSGVPAHYALLGILDIGGKVRIALPCACGQEDCEGWAMLSAESVLDHLALYAPSALREAYLEAVAYEQDG